jgi:hypothetical protein
MIRSITFRIFLLISSQPIISRQLLRLRLNHTQQLKRTLLTNPIFFNGINIRSRIQYG